MEQLKEITQTQTEPENSGIFFWENFGYYCQYFIYGKETKHWAMSRPNFNIFLKASSVLRSIVLRRSTTH